MGLQETLAVSLNLPHQNLMILFLTSQIFSFNATDDTSDVWMFHQNKTNNSDSLAFREQKPRTRQQRKQRDPNIYLTMYRINFYACD